MIIRPLLQKDIEACISLGEQMHRESDYKDLVFSREKCLSLGILAINDSNYCWLVAEKAGEIVGMIGGYVIDAYFSHALVANDFLVYVDPAHRGGLVFVKLIKAFVAWAQAAGAQKIHLSDSAMITAMGRLYERLGFEQVGGIYRRNA